MAPRAGVVPYHQSMKFWMLICFALNSFGAHASACFEEAATRYRVPVSLLVAISTVESGGNPKAINVNKNGSYDIGHMQINSSWLGKLAKYGITERSLYEPCINTNIGAWILAHNIASHGLTWEAVGAYNAVTPSKREAYARKVAGALKAQAQPRQAQKKQARG